MSHKMVRGAVLWSVVVSVVRLSSAEFQCSQQIISSGDSCHCEESSKAEYTYELYCPSLGNPQKVHIYYEPNKFLVMTCSNQATKSEVLNIVSGLELGPVSSVKLRSCPLWVEPLDTMFSAMGINTANIDSLQLSYLSRQSDEQLGGHHFKNMTKLRILQVSRFNVKKVDKTFFEHIPGLKGLDLTQNQGIQIDGSSFSELRELEEFTCHSCFLSSLEVNMFQGLTKLRHVSLHDNKIRDLKPGTFDTNTDLEILSFSKNILQTFPANIFKNLVNLTSIDLDYNNFTSFPRDLFKFNTKMKMFQMKVNGDNNPILGFNPDFSIARRLQLPDSLFPDTLEEIRMHWVLLENFPETLLQNCKSLVNITVQRGLISSLSESTFQGLTSLKMIDFSVNTITSLPPGLFKNLNSVERLRFLSNNLTSLDPGLLNEMRNLKVIHLDENQLETLPVNLFSQNNQLEELDLSKNKIRYSNKLTSATLNKLKILDLSHNNITFIADEMKHLFSDLRTLNLSHNNIGDLTLNDLHFIQTPQDGDQVVDLSHNFITRLDLTSVIPQLLISDNNFSHPLPFTLNMTNNPLVCDCDTVALKQLSEGTFNSKLKNFVRFEPELKCGDDNSQQTRRKRFSEIQYRDLDCDQGSCAGVCRCSVNKYYQETHMDCSYKNLNKFPEKLEMYPGTNTISLNMNYNRIRNLSFAVERYYQDSGAVNYRNIRKLYLSNNIIRTFHHECLPAGLEELYLDHNNITSFTQSDINYFATLVNNTESRLRLGRNPYTCDCDSRELFLFVKSSQGDIEDRGDMKLICDEGSRFLIRSKLEEFCEASLPLGAVVAIILLFLVCGIFAAGILIMYKRDILIIWVYAQPWGKKLFHEDQIDKEKPYDAFISYSQTDSDYVENTLLTGLENPEDAAHKFKCLIHTRDWNVGEMIPDQIIHSVESSRRTIIVLSKSYIDSMWTKLEFRAAHKQALQDRTQRVIIVVLGDLPAKEDMEEDLQKYISLNTYLDAKDPWFWQKLRYALPHRGRIMRARTRQETDRLELMRSQAELELGKRSPSPKTLDPKTLLKDQRNGISNGHVSNGHANGHHSSNGVAAHAQ